MPDHALLFSLPAGRPTRWLTDVGAGGDQDIRVALIGTLFGALPLFAAAALNTMVVAALVTARLRHPEFLAWLALEVMIGLSRLVTLVAARRAAASGRPTPTDRHILLSIAWAANVGLGTLLCLASGDTVSIILICLSATAMAGGICLRNFAAPRLAGVMILLSVAPCCCVGVITGEPILLITLLQMPFYLLSMSVAAFRLNAMLVATMRAERESAFQAGHDALTGLANRAGLASTMAARQPGAGSALLYLDLDGFKVVNDTYGHAVGDALLRQVAARLRGLLGAGDLAARIGGDEFVVLTDADAHPDFGALCGGIVAELSRPYDLPGGSPIVVGVSIGVALSSECGDGLDSLLCAADSGLYRAKSGGKARWCFGPRRAAGLTRDAAAPAMAIRA